MGPSKQKPSKSKSATKNSSKSKKASKSTSKSKLTKKSPKNNETADTSQSPPPTPEPETGIHHTESLPFTPVDDPFDQVFDEKAPPLSPEKLEPEDYLGESFINFGDDPNANKPLPALSEETVTATIIDVDALPTPILPDKNSNTSPGEVIFSLNNHKLAWCAWWKARSLECHKCQVQPLFHRPKPIRYDYGILRKSDKMEGLNGKGSQNGCGCGCNLNIDNKVIPGICSSCSQQESESSSNKSPSKVHPQPHRKSEDNCHQSGHHKSCNCSGKSEYQCSYAPPESQRLMRKGRNKIKSLQSEDAYLLKLYHLLHRPPFNLNTTMTPPPPWVESIGAAEAKLSALDEAKDEKRRRRHQRQKKDKQEIKGVKNKSKSNKNKVGGSANKKDSLSSEKSGSFISGSDSDTSFETEPDPMNE